MARRAQCAQLQVIGRLWKQPLGGRMISLLLVCIRPTKIHHRIAQCVHYAYTLAIPRKASTAFTTTYGWHAMIKHPQPESNPRCTNSARPDPHSCNCSSSGAVTDHTASYISKPAAPFSCSLSTDRHTATPVPEKGKHGSRGMQLQVGADRHLW